MKRRSRYPDKVIAYALSMRSRGIKWKQIESGIREAFGIKPPSERQMRDWYKEFSGSVTGERLFISIEKVDEILGIVKEIKELLEARQSN